MKYCPNCGRELADDMKFCGGCGTAQDFMPSTKKKKSNGKGLLVLPVLVVGAVVCLALFFENKDGKDDGNNRTSSISTGEVEENEILDESDKDEVAEKDTEIIWTYVEHFYDLGPTTFYLGSERIEDSLSEKYEHDSEGFIKKVFHYNSNDELVYTNDYIWEENRNSLKCISYNSKNEVDGTTEWNYEDGNLKSFKDWDLDGNLTWEVHFNEHGDILNEMKYEGEVIERYEYVYNEDAKLISKFGYEDESLVEKYEYFYDKWVSLADILDLIPLKTDSPEEYINKNRHVELKDTAFYYFLNVSDYRAVGEQEPYEFAMPEAKDMLVNIKRVDFMRQVKDDLYKRAIDRKKIIYNY